MRSLHSPGVKEILCHKSVSFVQTFLPGTLLGLAFALAVYLLLIDNWVGNQADLPTLLF